MVLLIMLGYAWVYAMGVLNFGAMRSPACMATMLMSIMTKKGRNAALMST